jgi:hypothetical protein
MLETTLYIDERGNGQLLLSKEFLESDWDVQLYAIQEWSGVLSDYSYKLRMTHKPITINNQDR